MGIPLRPFDQSTPRTEPTTAGRCDDTCRPECQSVFDRVHVSYLIRGGARILWDLLPTFNDPLPHEFQLQYHRTANPLADDWIDVGLPVVNAFVAMDGEQRVWGRTQDAHYRIKLTTPEGEYFSDPVGSQGVLNARDWRLAREILRQEQLRHRFASQEGFLLKRRINGPKCTLCVDLQTGESQDSNCPQCYGTSFQCGYYYPIGCIWADLQQKRRRVQIDNSAARGTIGDMAMAARMLMLPLVQEYDVWVAKNTDERYYIHEITHIAEFRGVPIIASVELRPAAYTDVVYDVPIPEQVL